MICPSQHRILLNATKGKYMHFILQIRQAIQKILIQIRHQRRHRIQTAHLTEEGRSYLLSMVSAQSFEPYLLAYISTVHTPGLVNSLFVLSGNRQQGLVLGFSSMKFHNWTFFASTIAS